MPAAPTSNSPNCLGSLSYPVSMSPLPAALASDPVGRQRLSREELSEHQRERIIEAAIGVFAKRGYTATTVDHIVAAAKIGVGSFYAHFSSREECFLAAYEQIVARSREQIEAGQPEDGSQPEKVLAALAALLDLIAAQPLAARLVLVEAQTAGARALAIWEASIAALVPELRGLRAESPLAQELPEGLEVATLGGVVWFLQQRILRGEAGDPEVVLPELAEIVIEPYLDREQTAALLSSRAA